MSVDEPVLLERLGWTMPCPACEVGIRYTLLTNDRAPTPFYYADIGNHVLLRAQDQARADALYAGSGDVGPGLDALHDLWRAIAETAPAPPDGGAFDLWEYVSCPHCGTELAYDEGRRNPSRRIHEPRIVLIDGAIVVGDDAASTWRVRVRLPGGGPDR